MAITRTKYIVYNRSGTGVRRHHFGPENNIIAEATGTVDRYDSVTAFPDQVFNGQTVHFAFMSIVGNTDGRHLYTEPGVHRYSAGAAEVTILVVYAPPGGIGDGIGIWVDAFNVDAGTFSDSPTFMQVLNPPTPPDSLDNPKTTLANVEGVVVTDSAENMRANATCDGLPFLEWKKITVGDRIEAARLVALDQGQSGEIWIAFYQSPPPLTLPDVPELVPYGNWIYVGNRWFKLPFPVVGGSPYPDPEPFSVWRPVTEKLLAAIQILEISTSLDAAVKKDAVNLAVKQIRAGADEVRKLGTAFVQNLKS